MKILNKMPGHIFFILCYLSLSHAYDLEVNLRMDTEFVDKVKDILVNDDEKAQIQFDINVPEELFSRIGVSPQQLLDSIGKKVLRTHKVATDAFTELQNKGIERIKEFASRLKKKLKPEVDLSEKVSKEINNYQSSIQKYFNNALKYKVDAEVDKQIIALDIVETSNELVYNGSKVLLNFIDANKHFPPEIRTDSIGVSLNKDNLNHMKADYDMICEKLSLCRSFPGFTDYFAGLIKELTDVPDNKFHNVLMKISKIVKTRSTYFLSMLGPKIIKKISYNLQNLIDEDLSDVKIGLTSVHRVITERRRWKNDENKLMRKKTRAVRILLDIVDKAFEFSGEKEMVPKFDATVKALRDWISGSRNDVETILYTFFSYSIGVLEKHLDAETKKEIQTLTQVLLHNNWKEGPEFNYLLNLGSNYTKKSSLRRRSSYIPLKLDDNTLLNIKLNPV